MKATKLIAVAMFAALALAIAGSAGAAGGHGSGHASSARAASHGAGHAGMGYRAGMRQGRFPGSYRYFPYYPYYGYGYGNGYYGNAIVENADEADWGEQWTSLYEDNDGPYARSTRENAPGQARMWEFPEK
ncbi:MAG: hypothetical protein ABSD51_07510 [Candidatus Binatus sp.]